MTQGECGVVGQDHPARTKLPGKRRFGSAKAYIVPHGFHKFARDIHGIDEPHGNLPGKVTVAVIRIVEIGKTETLDKGAGCCGFTAQIDGDTNFLISKVHH
ncbi:MAG TPA: hypothetical protein VJ936_03745, partial [Desulfobacteraceae bacterium]|nr:hypothetical protein [Desulfobacteraceae bacterium]